jgi:hypothetical protein
MKNEKQKKNFSVYRSGRCQKRVWFASLFPSERIAALTHEQLRHGKNWELSSIIWPPTAQDKHGSVNSEQKQKEEKRKKIYSRKNEIGRIVGP